MIKSFSEINDRFVIEYDESYQFDKKNDHKIWYEYIICKDCFVYLLSTTICRAYFSNKMIAKNVSHKLTEKSLKHQIEYLDFEVLITFDLSDCLEISKVLKAKRKRRLEENQRKRFVEAGKKTQFQRKARTTLRKD